MVPVMLLLVGTGCSGINATGTVSPLTFFLPGFVLHPPEPALLDPLDPPLTADPGQDLTLSQH
jgi:hypothetical protein